VQHGEVAAFAYLVLEEAGLPIPVPGDFLMLAFGVRAREGSILLWQVIAAMGVGTILGSSILYVLARRNGRSLVERFGPFVGIASAQLDRAERQLQRHGALAVILGRLLAGLRILTAIACGYLSGSLPCVPAQVQDLTHVAPVALSAEAVRQAFFGLILGLTYPVLRARHPSNREL
jgi:membrane protein DedA with SNARE-associated domain